jgi:hypothetical protein
MTMLVRWDFDLYRGAQRNVADKRLTDKPDAFNGWKDIINFRPPQVVQRNFTNKDPRNNYIHYIQEAVDTVVNLDFYPFRVKRLPTIDGAVASDGFRLLQFYRRHFGTFLPKSVYLKSLSLEFDEPMDEAKWNSDQLAEAVGSVLIFLLGDNAAVLASEVTSQSWTFTTVHLQADKAGSHPVSGNRRWGVIKENDAWIFYNRGADRATQWVDEYIPTILTRSAQHAVWKGLQRNMIDFVRNNGGDAEELRHEQWTPSWELVKQKGLFYQV